MKPRTWVSSLLLFVGLSGKLSNTRIVPFVDPPDDLLQEERIILGPLDGVALTPEISRAGWTVTADSFQEGYPPINAIDVNTRTYWHSQYEPAVGLPHHITVDMTSVYLVNGVTYQPRQDGSSNGNIGQHQVLVSTDGSNYNLVAFGTWLDDSSTKTADFETIPARFIRIVALTEAGNRGPWTTEINVLNGAGFVPPLARQGLWGLTINFPLVPVAASLQPNSGRVIVWSAYSARTFGGDNGRTVTALYDPTAQMVTERVVTNTGHDMFCPGISLDANGRTLVTGGSSTQKASIYTPTSDTWASAPNMILSRGYQSSATCGDGRIFVIGGSWSGWEGGKDAEIYDPTTNRWSLLPGCPVAPMLTGDTEGVFRSDNHAWLFGWKNGSVFQAGPSMAMNWYATRGSGSQQMVGTRASDADSMCGTAIMYDAVAGTILTLGGSRNYQNSQASAAAHLITIGDPGTRPQVTKLGDMAYARIFHNSVVLPDGKVFTAGGQSVGAPFQDTNLQFIPEMWDPATTQFTQMTPNSTPRVYHSFALLLLDATILVGGGGLCDTCSANHFDAQVFTPPYLLNSDGSKASRPVIGTVSSTSVVPGSTITVTVNMPVTSMSLIRYGSATHTVNTDQRRIPLTLTPAGSNANSYRVTIPNDYGIALPGYWMLFAIDGEGRPSVAVTIHIRGP
ncbi:carbohydrate-binding module 32 [Lipomyces tetrasporus]|uniref:Carbohydrate-binding module 32 n=1 Tax=Lipomyces tetrasporus TaxID=54092 RepID=A0AAD7QMH0_9ASCO|nr:carbohydrate-binding module 32 [Lipomyces tetrasporus]KAJ8098037.1 carbohydrate-binding module 32 [Lipomyces tetrasporus]